MEELTILEELSVDKDHGNRRHAWIVILSNVEWAAKQSAGCDHEFDDETPIQPFFIEPSTGLHFSTDDPNYIAIDSVWNEKNYFVSFHNYEHMHLCIIIIQNTDIHRINNKIK